MIPKIIHYCWLSGDPYPEKIKYCISTWHQLLPDYKLMLWNTETFPLNNSEWVEEAFNAKKYAFAADYIRLYAVYKYGGIYLDSDVEVLKKFDNLLELPYFIGGESYEDRVEMAAFGAREGCAWVKRCLDYYENRHFRLSDNSLDMKVLPAIIHEVVSSSFDIRRIDSINDFIDDDKFFNVFPNDWFCANIHLKPTDNTPTYVISANTYCVHHFANSWLSHSKFIRIKLFVKRLLLSVGLGIFFNKHN